MGDVLAIVPARAGSKRILGKNKRLFMGKPLIYWTIEAALRVPDITDIVVSTDDEGIIAAQALFPTVKFHRRPKNLAQDNSSSVDVILDVMSRFEKPYEQIVLLQPTSPLRNSTWIQKALACFSESECQQLVSVRRCREVPSHIMKESGGHLVPLLDGDKERRLQDWEKLWVLNGAIYISDWNIFLERRSFLTEYTKSFEMPENLSIDIDTEEDWQKAEVLAKDLLWK